MRPIQPNTPPRVGRRRASARAVLVLAAALGVAGAAPKPRAAPTPPADAAPVLPAELERLIVELNHRDWRVRERAQERLAELGAAVEPRLQRVLAQAGAADGQTCLGAENVLAAIDTTRRLGPTLVSMHAARAAPKQVFADLSRQVGVPIAPLWGERFWQQRDNGGPGLTLDAAGEPFWSVMRRACVATNLRPLYTGGEEEAGRIVLTADVNAEMAHPVTFSGSFMILATSAARRSGLFQADSTATDVELQFTFFADPKWRIVDHPNETAIEAVTDAAGRTLPKPEPMQMQVYKPASPIWLMRTTLPKVPLEVPVLARIRGNFQIVLLEQSAPIEIAEVMTARNVVKHAGRQSLHLQEATRVNDAYRLRVTIGRNGLTEQEWRQTREADAIHLVDANGRALTRNSFEVQEEGDQATYDISFLAGGDVAGGPGAPARLVCQIPLEPRTVKVPFEFKDVVLQK